MRKRKWISTIALALAITMGSLSVGVPRLEAMAVPAAVATGQTAGFNRAADMQSVQSALENRLVRQRLADMGLSESEINTRLGRLSDQQLHQVSMQIEKQNPAGDDAGTVWTIAAVLLLVLILLKLIDKL